MNVKLDKRYYKDKRHQVVGLLFAVFFVISCAPVDYDVATNPQPYYYPGGATVSEPVRVDPYLVPVYTPPYYDSYHPAYDPLYWPSHNHYHGHRREEHHHEHEHHHEREPHYRPPSQAELPHHGLRQSTPFNSYK